jgi:hypothetical protein
MLGEDRRTRVVSTFRRDGLQENEVWQLASRHVDLPERTVRAGAELLVGRVRETGLSALPDDRPERHVNLTGWPEAKPARLSIQQRLAAGSRLTLRPVPESFTDQI